MVKCADDYGFCRLTQVSEQAVIPSLDISTPGLAAPVWRHPTLSNQAICRAFDP